MAGLFFLSLLMFVGGFVAADRLQPLFAKARFVGPVFEHKSYGGVTRRCPRSGGVLLVGAVVLTVLPLSLLGVGLSGFITLVLSLALWGRMRESAPVLIKRSVARMILLGIALTVPSQVFVFVLLGTLIGYRLWIALEAQDRVAGIPGSLYAPPLVGGGLLLVVVHHNADGLFGLAVAGSLVNVHALHRFPPRLICGRSGLLIVASAQLIVFTSLMSAEAWIAIGTLWSVPATVLALECWQSWHEPTSLFERARCRGEPEAGLAAAAGSLACANVILVWSTLAQPLAIRFAALGLSLFLAWQFARFLARGTRAPTAPLVVSGEGGGSAG